MPSRSFLLVPLVAAALAACGTEPVPPAPPAAAGSPAATPGAAAAPAPATRVVDYTVTGGKVDGPRRLNLEKGEAVTLRVTSDKADEVHVHGVERTVRLSPDAPADVEVQPQSAGIFEVELHDQHLRLVQLVVR